MNQKIMKVHAILGMDFFTCYEIPLENATQSDWLYEYVFGGRIINVDESLKSLCLEQKGI